jgi:hypothetical protein
MALDQQAPPLRQNRRPKIFYGTQVATYPPTIVLFTNGPALFDNTYQRYLLKAFRDHLAFGDVPIKLYLRHKRREDQPALDEREHLSEVNAGDEEDSPAPPPRGDMDVSRLNFRSKVTKEDLERDKGHYESELWRNL